MRRSRTKDGDFALLVILLAATGARFSQLKRMTESGVEVYVGGGEGGAALEKYGEERWVTHVFTAGGTVLNALGSEPVPFLVALRMAAEKSSTQ